jgi:hypothetical protein
LFSSSFSFGFWPQEKRKEMVHKGHNSSLPFFPSSIVLTSFVFVHQQGKLKKTRKFAAVKRMLSPRDDRLCVFFFFSLSFLYFFIFFSQIVSRAGLLQESERGGREKEAGKAKAVA